MSKEYELINPFPVDLAKIRYCRTLPSLGDCAVPKVDQAKEEEEGAQILPLSCRIQLALSFSGTAAAAVKEHNT